MASVSERLRTRGKVAAESLGRFGAGVRSAGVAGLYERVTALEEEVQECRRLNLRLAELTDVVAELLLPLAQRDEAKVNEAMERYSRGL